MQEINNVKGGDISFISVYRFQSMVHGYVSFGTVERQYTVVWIAWWTKLLI
jgi:hypothetical protein